MALPSYHPRRGFLNIISLVNADLPVVQPLMPTGYNHNSVRLA